MIWQVSFDACFALVILSLRTVDCFPVIGAGGDAGGKIFQHPGTDQKALTGKMFFRLLFEVLGIGTPMMEMLRSLTTDMFSREAVLAPVHTLEILPPKQGNPDRSGSAS